MKKLFSKNKPLFSAIVTVLILAMTIFAYWGYQSFINWQLNQTKIMVTLKSVTDGDTAKFVTIDNNVITVRFLCIDTPEMDTEAGVEAKEYTESLLQQASIIQLMKDDASSDKDKYDRYLYYVFVDGQLLEIKIIENGYGEVKYCDEKYHYYEELMHAQKLAQDKSLGIWE